MVLMKSIIDGVMQTEDRSLEDVRVGPACSESIFLKRWEDMVSAWDDGTGDIAALTFEQKEALLLEKLVLMSTWDNLTLEEAKVVRKRQVKKQASDAFGELYSLFEGLNCIVACLGTIDPIDRTKALYSGLRTDVIAYRQALITARAAIDEATTKEQVIAINFVVT